MKWTIAQISQARHEAYMVDLSQGPISDMAAGAIMSAALRMVVNAGGSKAPSQEQLIQSVQGLSANAAGGIWVAEAGRARAEEVRLSALVATLEAKLAEYENPRCQRQECARERASADRLQKRVEELTAELDAARQECARGMASPKDELPSTVAADEQILYTLLSSQDIPPLRAHAALSRLAIRARSTYALADKVKDLTRQAQETEKVLVHERAERDAAHTAASEATDRRLSAEHALANARQDASVWRKRVETAAEELADVGAGEIGRLDIVSRVRRLKAMLPSPPQNAGAAEAEVPTLWQDEETIRSAIEEAGLSAAEQRRFWTALQSLISRTSRAERALLRAGFTHAEGAQEWRPPLGPSASPLLDKISSLETELQTLKQQRDRRAAERDGALERLKAQTEEVEDLRTRLQASEDGNRDLVRRAQEAESLHAAARKHVAELAISENRQRDRAESAEKRCEALTAGSSPSEVAASVQALQGTVQRLAEVANVAPRATFTAEQYAEAQQEIIRLKNELGEANAGRANMRDSLDAAHTLLTEAGVTPLPPRALTDRIRQLLERVPTTVTRAAAEEDVLRFFWLGCLAHADVISSAIIEAFRAEMRSPENRPLLLRLHGRVELAISLAQPPICRFRHGPCESLPEKSSAEQSAQWELRHENCPWRRSHIP